MKKFAKMSLVAAVAVAGLSTTSSAKALEEAIKNVEVSGTVAYRYNDYDSGVHSNNYKIGLNVSSKVNDDVTANTRFVIGEKSTSLNTTNTGDANVEVKLQEVNFAYNGVQNLTVTVGKQGIATPWTVARDSMGNESTGTGAVATYTAGPVTLVGAYFNQTNLGETLSGEITVSAAQNAAIGASDIYVVGAMASFAGINADAFYTDMSDQFDAYTVSLKASYDVGAVKLSPFARYSALEADKNGDVAAAAGSTDKQKLWQVGLGASMGMFNAFAAYGESGSDGGLVYLDSGAATNMDYHWRITANGTEADAEYLYAHVDADVTSSLNVGLFYSEADFKTSNDKDEIYVQAKYKMSKNLLTYVRLGQLDEDTQDKVDMGRLHVQYSF